ncbi:MAG TPA: peptidoglycan-binding domain-containing protein [Ktedonobacteraceae bacterium]|nr:peptidoglycan-binding domain-containing protein [Ktedonobacteraceae bacterium]
MRKNIKLLVLGVLFLAAMFTFTALPSATPSAHAASLTPVAAASACSKTVQRGSSGDPVPLLQRELNLTYSGTSFKAWVQPHAPSHFPIAEDGLFGTQTYNALRDFQTWAHLTVDGIVGPNTWRALDFDLRQAFRAMTARNSMFASAVRIRSRGHLPRWK